MVTTASVGNNRKALLAGGIVSIILGLLLLIWTEATLSVIIFFIGIWWLIQGLILIFYAYFDRSRWIWKVAGGITGILAGLIVLISSSQPGSILPEVLLFILGIMGIFIGATFIMGTFREAMGSKTFGVISIIIIGVILVMNTLLGDQLTLWLIAGLLILEGIVAVFISYR